MLPLNLDRISDSYPYRTFLRISGILGLNLNEDTSLRCFWVSVVKSKFSNWLSKPTLRCHMWLGHKLFLIKYVYVAHISTPRRDSWEREIKRKDFQFLKKDFLRSRCDVKIQQRKEPEYWICIISQISWEEWNSAHRHARARAYTHTRARALVPGHLLSIPISTEKLCPTLQSHSLHLSPVPSRITALFWADESGIWLIQIFQVLIQPALSHLLSNNFIPNWNYNA